jgi:hypothetical protein
VKFNRNVTACAFIGTVGRTDFELIEKGVLDVAGAAGTEDSVFVETHALNTEATANKSFHLAVFC